MINLCNYSIYLYLMIEKILNIFILNMLKVIVFHHIYEIIIIFYHYSRNIKLLYYIWNILFLVYCLRIFYI